ncbi:nucleotidyltransferase family protein [Klebsiella aerogenes]
MNIAQAPLDRLLCRLLFDPQHAGELTQTLSAEQWQHCLERAVNHKILPHVAMLYQQYQALPLPENYQTILHTHTLERSSWLAALRLAAPFSQSANAMLMKGFGHELLYPEKIDRFAKDMDVVVADFTVFCDIANQLLNNGFHLPFMTQFIWRKELKSWQGLARFIHREGNEDGGVELHIGQFAVDEAHKLSWPTLHAQATVQRFGELPLCMPDTTMMLTVFFMELATRPECMLRDLYDGYCLCMTLTDQDKFDMLVTALNKAQLGEQVIKLIAAFNRFNHPTPQKLLQLEKKVRTRGPSGKCNWRNRIRKRLDSACQNADVLLRLYSIFDRPWAIRLAMHFAIPIYGIPMSSHPQPLRLIKRGRYRLLTTQAGTFLLGGVGIFSDEEIEYLQSVIASSPLPLTPEPEP